MSARTRKVLVTGLFCAWVASSVCFLGVAFAMYVLTAVGGPLPAEKIPGMIAGVFEAELGFACGGAGGFVVGAIVGLFLPLKSGAQKEEAKS